MTDGAMLTDNVRMAPSPHPNNTTPSTPAEWEAHAAELVTQLAALTVERNMLKADLARERAARRVIDGACKDLIEALADIRQEQAIIAKEVNP